jgi:hypothetical protein
VVHFPEGKTLIKYSQVSVEKFIKNYTATPPLGLHGPLYGELYLYNCIEVINIVDKGADVDVILDQPCPICCRSYSNINTGLPMLAVM